MTDTDPPLERGPETAVNSEPENRVPPNGLGLGALILGVASLVGSFIPFLDYVTGFSAILAVILGVVELRRADHPKRPALAAAVLGGVALVTSIALAIVYSFAIMGAAETSSLDKSNAPNAASARVPSLVFGTLEQAWSVAASDGLTLSVKDKAGDSIAEGDLGNLEVLSQVPASGTKLPSNGIIAIVVANPISKAIPNVVGSPESTAIATLKTAGFTTDVQDDEGLADGKQPVAAQSPAAGTMAYATSTVTLTLTPHIVPNVIGSTETAAAAALTAAGLSVTIPEDSGLSDGNRTIATQTPAAGIAVPLNASVSLTLNPPTVVYTITGNGSRASSITYTTGDANQEQATNARLPWSYSMPKSGSLGYIILAQDGNGTSITCTITDDGTVVSTNTSTGRYAIAECQGG